MEGKMYKKPSDLVSTPRSHKRAKTAKLLSGYKIFLTRSIKPERDQMADIIKCAGGEVLSTLPLSVEEGVLIVACEEDIGSCRAAMEAGVPVHSTELILGGVLHQELDLHLYPTLSSSFFTSSSLFLHLSISPVYSPSSSLYCSLSFLSSFAPFLSIYPYPFPSPPFVHLLFSDVFSRVFF